MQTIRYFLLLTTVLFTAPFSALCAQKVKGMTFVAPPKEVGTNAMQRIGQTNSNWVTFVPYAFQRANEIGLIYNTQRQWWGERHEGIIKCIELARAEGLSVMIKPQVWIRGSWIGDLDMKTVDAWKIWEESYSAYIMDYALMAEQHDAEMLCIGTEVRISVRKRPQFWKKLIRDIRKVYKGKLVYSANWDDYQEVGFWKELDYVGISAYFPLDTSPTPDVNTLVNIWKPIKQKVLSYCKKQNKKLLFTEYGYLTVDGCAGKTWELEKQRHALPLNHTAQVNAFEALYTTWWQEDQWAGGFIWKWFPEGQGHEGQVDKDYTPQNKPSEAVVKRWYGR